MSDSTSDEVGDFSPEATRDVLETACSRVGLDSTGATLIRTGENALYRLSVAPIVVRIARAMDYWQQVQNEVSVAEWLAEVSFPAVRVTDLKMRQPLEVDGHPVTFWKFLPGGDATQENIVELALLLRQFHNLQTPSRFELPKFKFDERVTRRLENAPISTSDKDFLITRFSELCREVEKLRFPLRECPIHGDAHIKNVMLSAERNPILIDFENVGFGHPEWDLAVTATEYMTARLWSDSQYRTFAESYGYDVTEWSGFDVLRQVQEIKMTTWLMQNVNQSRDISEEFKVRMRTIRTGKVTSAWKPY